MLVLGFIRERGRDQSDIFLGVVVGDQYYKATNPQGSKASEFGHSGL